MTDKTGKHQCWCLLGCRRRSWLKAVKVIEPKGNNQL
jgi:hypothetical protein